MEVLLEKNKTESNIFLNLNGGYYLNLKSNQPNQMVSLSIWCLLDDGRTELQEVNLGLLKSEFNVDIELVSRIIKFKLVYSLNEDYKIDLNLTNKTRQKIPDDLILGNK